MGSLNTCWRGRLQLCKLVSHPDSKMSTSFLPPPKKRNLARATVLLSAQDEALDNLSRAVQEEGRKELI